MAYENFKPTVWAKSIERERDNLCIGAKLSNRDYEANALEYGKNITINWTRRPVVKNYVPGTAIATPETLESNSSTIALDKMKYVNFMVDDVDELQSAPNIMQSCMKEAAGALADDLDKCIYNLYTGGGSVINNHAVNSKNIVQIVSDAANMLYSNNVPMNEELSLEVSPAIYQKLWLAKVLRQTPNDKVFGNGFVGMFDNFKVYMTNNIVKDETTTDDYCFARTSKAIAVVAQMQKMEAYRPQGSFADAVKGLHVYGAAVVRPKELVVLKIKAAAEPA
ncbi:MAG: P22 phage major capsid protein family protein [Clostridia bacterium]